MTPNPTTPKKPVRCAIYTRKSSDQGLNQEFSSLDAQRECGISYIASQKGEGWVCLPDRYDDGGYTGANTERPGLQRLLADIHAGKIDVVVVYKLDRLSRSLSDFSRLMEQFDKKNVSFVSVTQSFNSTSSMGRLTLNILLSFAQFEREIISERTRDKIAATRRKGIYAVGKAPLGYDFVPLPPPHTGKRLVPNAVEAERVRSIFAWYLEERSLLKVAAECVARGWTAKGGAAMDKKILSKLLKNVIYTGRVPHGAQVYAGEHEAIIDPEMFQRVQAQLRLAGQRGGTLVRASHPALLRGLVRCGACQCAMTPTTASRRRAGGGVVKHTYYVCGNAVKRGRSTCPCPSIPGSVLEPFVIDQLKASVGDDRTLRAVVDRAGEILREAAAARSAELTRLRAQLATPMDTRAAERIKRRLTAVEAQVARDQTRLVDEDELAGAVEAFDGVWNVLTSAEREELVREVVAGVEYDAATESVTVTFRDQADAETEQIREVA